jgi:outer membrane lipoprotein SlyB|tara:strand:- start:148 stop:594 length:447 start_codon:yes stop_codon:yes gene_type:complete
VLYKLFVALTVSLYLSACVDGVGKYRVESIGNAQRSVGAVVISYQPVFVQTESSGTGALIGGTTGGYIADDNSDNPFVIIAGVIGGAIVGEMVESDANTHEATEYVIQTENDLLLTVVQINKNNPIFKTGERVILIHGYPSRLIRDTR